MEDTFKMAREAYESLADLRHRRRRYKRYTYGNQWCDRVDDRGGAIVSEYEAARRQGQVPHTNNLLRQLVKCVIGNFRSSLADGDAEALPESEAEVVSRNSLTEMDCRMLEEFLISGCAIQRVVNENRPAGSGVWVDNVSPEDFFVNRFTDPRGLDIDLVGMLHSMSLREVRLRFGGRGPEVMGRIARAYAGIDDDFGAVRTAVGRGSESRFLTAEADRCRVIEVWRLREVRVARCHDPLESRLFTVTPDRYGEVRELNDRRRRASKPCVEMAERMSLRWHCTFFTPRGEVLDEYDSPYGHGMHPFVVKLYPLIDGEVHSLVEDLIDQQRCINSLITLIDQIMRVSAKGVLLFPADQKMGSMTWDEVVQTWAMPNAVIPYMPGRNGAEPHQAVTPADNSGAYRLLQTQLELFQQISGVSEAMQGRLPQTNTSAALFESQLRSSMVALLDILDSFNSFRGSRNRHLLSAGGKNG